MNYFEIFGIKPSFKINQDELRKAYYEKSREYHPDRFGLLSAEEQMNALEMSTEINKAYKTLADLKLRTKYLLEITGIEFVEGNESVPQEFLMEIMDLNEMIMELKMGGDSNLKQDVLKQLNSVKSELNESIQPIFESFNFEKTDKNELKLIKDYYLKSKYLDRIESNLDN